MTDDIAAPDTTAPVAVCGAGAMGRGIAHVFAAAGRDVLLYDVSDDAVSAAIAQIGAELDRAVGKGRVTSDAAHGIAARVQGVAAIQDFAPASLIVETVTEDLSLKQGVFAAVEAICAPSAIIATNTSTLSPTEIASVVRDPGRTCGVHFFNPPPRMRLVEAMPGLHTRPEVVAALVAALEDAGKYVVTVKESPGGIVSRLQLLLRNEALRMLAEGVASAADIDAAMRLGCGWPMGPLQLIDLVGVDVHVANSDILARELASNRYAPHPYARQLLRGGMLGQKSGRGLYTYDGSTAAEPSTDGRAND